MMKTSPRGIEDLVLSEGLRTEAYRDTKGIWTIGYGHAATSGRPPIPHAGMKITVAEAKRILAADLAEQYEPDVNAALGPVPQHVFDGAVSFHFNTGKIRSASWVRAYKKGDMEAARKAFMLWNKPKEIIGRRTREADLIFNGKYATGAKPPAPSPTGDPILRKGDGVTSATFRDDVKELQQLLDAAGFPPGAMDGRFGLLTEAKVIAFQRARGIDPDGIVGPKTWAALRAPLADAPVPATTVARPSPVKDTWGTTPPFPIPPPSDPVPHQMEPDLPEDQPPAKETTVFKGKQKAWFAFIIPWAVAAAVKALQAAGIDVGDPGLVETGILSVLSGLGVYQVANRA